MMFEGFDEADLLALIEDGLEPERAAVLRQRLADDPQAAAMIERLRSDRDVLRTTPDPPVPADLLAELEPLIARPMLMPEPTDWRRRYRRRRPWGRYAVAAAAAIAVLAGVWATVTAIGKLPGPQPAELAAAPQTNPPSKARPAGATAAVPDDDTWPPDGAVIHHHAPDTALADARVADELAGPALRPAPAAAPGNTQLVLVVNAGDDDTVEAALRRALADVAGHAALVRNFSYEEAERLFQEHRMAGARRAPDDLAQALADFGGVGTAKGGAAAPPDRQRRRRAAERLALTLEKSDHAPGGRLLGPKALAPGYDRQLEFSELGATFTLAIPAGALGDVLARLQLDQGQATTLRTADGLKRDPGAGPWPADYAQARAAALGLDPGEIVLLPVVVSDR